MRIVDIDGNEIQTPDLSLGYLMPDKLFLRHHEAVAPVEAVIEKVITKFPNGGVDIDPVTVSAAVPAKDAWDEYEDIQRYIAYTPEELAEKEAAEASAKNRAERINQLVKSGVLEGDLKELYDALNLILSGVTE